MKLKQLINKTYDILSIMLMLFVLLTAYSLNIFAQFTFTGDYDRTFAAPDGYFTEPQNNDPTIPSDAARTSGFFTGGLNADGSIIAGGRISRGDAGDFWLRKFTATGAVDASFGGGAGYVRTTFFTNTSGYNNVLPQVVKIQPDGKILFAGHCDGQTSYPNTNASFGSDICVVRYNADGTLDASFGNNSVVVGDTANSCPSTNSCSYVFQPGAGKFTIQSGQIVGNNFAHGTNGTIYDITLQSDGKIILAGETRDELSGGTRYVGILVRLNANGSLDTSFGANGIARLVGPNVPNGQFPNAYGSVRFNKVLVQPDGRIIAAGYDGTVEDYFTGTVFLVTRWTASGQLETKRRLDNNASQAARESATGLLLSRDGGKVLVSGLYQNDQTLVRLNLTDLSLDSTFGTNGIKRYSYQNLDFNGLVIKTIQPDSKILAVDRAANSSGVVRFNPDGSPDQSFGNAAFIDGQYQRGRLNLGVRVFNGDTSRFGVSQILLRADGKFNLIGTAGVNVGFGTSRGAISQNINSLHENNYTDFTNDGKTDFTVFRPSDTAWYQMDSSNYRFSTFQWGLSTDKLAPADYDGDGKTDWAVFRDGVWYIYQSSNGQVRYAYFGLSGDIPRPGDFDGDGYADIAVFRPSDGIWYWLNSSNGQYLGVQFGKNGDVPLLADFNGDGKSDISVFRNGVWYFIRSSDASVGTIQFGLAGDIPVVGDYDGDSKSDLAVFRNGIWYVLRSLDNGVSYFNWGLSSDKIVPGDYDNDGKTDAAIYRDGVWWILYSGSNSYTTINFGVTDDKPIPTVYLP